MVWVRIGVVRCAPRQGEARRPYLAQGGVGAAPTVLIGVLGAGEFLNHSRIQAPKARRRPLDENAVEGLELGDW